MNGRKLFNLLFRSRAERPAVGLQRAVRRGCPECKSLDPKHHHPHCSLQTLEQRAGVAVQYYEAWLRQEMHNRKRVERMGEEIARLQGKIVVLRHENNALRRKVVGAPNVRVSDSAEETE